jgi:hypothetical protein
VENDGASREMTLSTREKNTSAGQEGILVRNGRWNEKTGVS